VRLLGAGVFNVEAPVGPEAAEGATNVQLRFE
jgi:hypothetical protein